jgi:outer membrane protein insertion porin family
MKFVLSIMAVFCMMFAVSRPLAASPFSGLSVTQVVIQDDQGRGWQKEDQVPSLIQIKPGDRFSSEAIRTSISYLFLTGKFRDVRVDGFPDGAGVKLFFTLVPITVVDAVVIQHNHGLSKKAIRQVLGSIEGRELREDHFPAYRFAIAALYQDEGYNGCTVDIQVVPLKRPHYVKLLISVREPKRTVIGSVQFSGNTFFSAKQLLTVMDSRPGQPLRTSVLLDRDLPALIKKYADAGYPTARSGTVEVSFRNETASIMIAVTEGPRVFVGFSGNRVFSENDLRKQILIWSEQDISDSVIESSADKIKALYQRDGYMNVKVTTRKAQSAGNFAVVFEIDEGQRVTVQRIVLNGNRYFSTDQIRKEMTLRESGLFSSVPFQQEVLDKDVEYLQARYVDAGFLTADVRKRVDLQKNGRKAVVAIDITEGPQTRTGTITFEGQRIFTPAELQRLISLKPGKPYNERLVDEDRYRILAAYSEKGYLYARVESERKPSDGTVDIVYRISEDQPVRIGRVILRGNERTKEYVIRRELLVKPGDPYNYEKILKSQQRIYRFGYFNQARFEPVNPGEKQYVKDMLLSVEEGNAGLFEAGVGYGDLDRLRLSVGASYRNVWGLAHYAGVRLEQSSILSRAILNYQHPRFFGYDLEGKFALIWSDTQHINADTRDIYYETRQGTASYGVEKKMDKLKTSLTYAYESVKNYNIQPGVILSFEDIGHVRVSSLSPAAVWDFRDDIFNPKKGALYGILLKEAMHQIGSQADFTKLSVQGSWYVPLNESVVTAFAARGGMSWPHYETNSVPLHERFYLGGGTTVRGYIQDAVGPQNLNPDGTTAPTGGSGMWLLNAEVRFMPSTGFGFIVFFDEGRVWINESEFIINKPDDLRPPARASYGVGIRYGTPVGPLRLDYGQKIHRLPGESPGEFHFNIGNTF